MRTSVCFFDRLELPVLIPRSFGMNTHAPDEATLALSREMRESTYTNLFNTEGCSSISPYVYVSEWSLLKYSGQRGHFALNFLCKFSAETQRAQTGSFSGNYAVDPTVYAD